MNKFGDKKKLNAKEFNDLCIKWKFNIRKKEKKIKDVNVCGIVFDVGSGVVLDEFYLYVQKEEAWNLVKYMPNYKNQNYNFYIADTICMTKRIELNSGKMNELLVYKINYKDLKIIYNSL